MAQHVKELMLKELEERFGNIQQTGCVVVGYQGMKADEARRLRQEARRQSSQVMVVKNSLFALALDHLGVAGVGEMLAGPSAVVHGPSAVEAARAADAMAKACPAVQLRGAYVDGQVLGPDGVRKLARIPDRETLLAGALMAPLRRLAAGLLSKPRALMSILDQMKQNAAAETQS